MVGLEHNLFRRGWRVLALCGVILAIGLSPAARAQDSAETCPCFSSEEVEAIFQAGEEMVAAGGGASCYAKDYSVEFSGEVAVTDQNYHTVSRASVKWADYDPGTCELRITTADPPVERQERWPNPAPEAPVRACLEIIASVIARLDSSGRCTTYP